MESLALSLCGGGRQVLNLLVASLVSSILLNFYFYQLYTWKRDEVKSLRFWNDVFHGTLTELVNKDKEIYKP